LRATGADDATLHRLKLLHMVRTLDPRVGGSIEALRQFAPVLVRAGHIVEVATLDEPSAAWLRGFPIPVHALGPARGRYGYRPGLVPWIRARAPQYDAVVVEGLWQYHGFATWQALHGRSPYVVFTHGMLDPWFKRRYPLKHVKKWLYWPWAEYRVLRDATAVLFTCENECQRARQSFWLYDCTEVVSNLGTADPAGDPEGQAGEFFARYPELRGKRLALFLSRIHAKKGCDLLVKAFAETLARDPDWHLVMAGPDQDGWRAKLTVFSEHAGIANRITWTGMLEGDVKWSAYRAAEMLVLPSHSENFGFVVAEAMACGLPVLISDKVNIWHEIEQDGAGFVGADTLAGTTDLLRRWVSLDDMNKNAIRQRARECFLRRYEIEAAAANRVRTLEGILSGRRAVRK
jgi:glycosyltransferase involved in cell wall biosynthesis